MRLLFASLLCAVCSGQTPVNQVFQFMQAGTSPVWADGKTISATAYLWIPEKCRKLRGLLVMASNVPEHMLVGDRSIRAVAAANDLGIVWGSPTFWYSKARHDNEVNEDKTVVTFLQSLLDGLAKTSGYPEVATVPWLPMGESGHLLMVDALVEAAPERCIAGIWIKNAHLPPHNRTVPALVVFGSAQEWGQDKVDIHTRWNNLTPYDNVLKQRQEHPNWPLSFVFDGGSGHFDVSARLVQYFAHYIDVITKARLGRDGLLRAIPRNKGIVADLHLPGHAIPGVAPWFPDPASAREAQSIAAINWKAETQIPAFQDGKGKLLPFDFNGISSITPEMEADGITFRLQAVMLDQLPANFMNAGSPLTKAPGTPGIEWLSGAVEPLGDGRFRVALDRTWPQQAVYLAARQKGTAQIRDAVQPIGVKLQRNTTGKPQKIQWDPISDVRLSTKSIPIHAVSDSGLPVGYFVVAGPAVIENGRVVFSAVPPQTRFPVEVTVAAWQWGRGGEQPVRAADTVKQTFHITK